MTPDAILAIPLDRPDLLFSGKGDAQNALRALRNKWHPDRSQRPDVFAHIEALYENRKRMLNAGTWKGSGTTTFVTRRHGVVTVNYLRMRPFELGTMYICRASLIYVIDKQHDDLMLDATHTLKSFKFPSDTVREKVEYLLPKTKTMFELDNGVGTMLVLERGEDLVALRDLLDHLGGTLDPKHVAWIMTRLHYMTNYLEWAGLTHNSIDLDTCFVSPPLHTLALLGGWWFAKPDGEPLRGLTSTAADVWESALLPSVTRAKRATPLLDREMIRLVGRTLLGDASGASLHRKPEIPAALARWVTIPTQRSAREDYKAWEAAREDAFGKRRFTKLEVTAQDIYGG